MKDKEKKANKMEDKKIENKEPEKKTEVLTLEEKTEDAPKKKKKIKRQVFKGRAFVKSSYNNTIISIADMSGALLGWSSSGKLGFKGAKKSTPYAATQVAGDVSEKVKKFGMRELEVFVSGLGGGREASVRALANKGFSISIIKDITPIPHNGCRAKKPRRV